MNIVDAIDKACYVLENPLIGDRVWTTQGFGMIRTYLGGDETWRLNVWDDRLKTEHVSTIHDHPWSFTSTILCGELVNERFVETAHPLNEAARDPWGWLHYDQVLITTGEGGHVVKEDMQWLAPQPLEVYHKGETYQQHALEMHRTTYLRGTVTLNEREPYNRPQGKVARVCFIPIGGRGWISAEPREATDAEVIDAVWAVHERGLS